jgi:hypothetical protein
MAEIGGPPLLRIGHQRGEVALHRRQVEAFEGAAIIIIVRHWIAGRRVLVEDRKIELVRPPQPVGHFEQDGVPVHLAARHRALRFDVHGILRSNSPIRPGAQSRTRAGGLSNGLS